LQRVETLTETLLEHLAATTPAAAVQWAGTPQERRMVTSLGRLAADVRAAGFTSPAVLLVGGAVGEAACAVGPEAATPGAHMADAIPTADDVIAQAA
jgi:uroporphyrin-III C-methyltransferase